MISFKQKLSQICSHDNRVKLLWILALSFSITGLFFYIYEIYIKWIFNPDILIAVKLIPSYQIPLPAITICTPLLARKDVANISEIYALNMLNIGVRKNRRKINNQCLPAFVHSCNSKWANSISPSTNFDNFNQTVEYLDRCSPQLNETFINCFHQNEPIFCEQMVNRVLNDEGFCFSLNMLGINSIFNHKTISSDFKSYRRTTICNPWHVSNTILDDDLDEPGWSLPSGYKNIDTHFPTRASKVNSIELVLMMDDTDLPNLCNARSKSFKVIFHLPNEMPNRFHLKNYVKLEDTKQFDLSAKMFTVDESLKEYSPKSRECYFEGERKLKYFSAYTKVLCDLECLSNYTLENCGCVKFSMPREEHTKVCDLDMINCAQHADLIWPGVVEGTKTVPCDCLPSCTNIKYEITYEKVTDFDYESSEFAGENRKIFKLLGFVFFLM